VARKYPYGERGKWGHPLPPFQRDRHLWARFCRTVDQRIADVRWAEGIDGRREDWQTFEHRLPTRVLPFRPSPSRVRMAPTLPRDARGRLMARSEEAASRATRSPTR
jgi:hypothetical protein